ncbi:hypothetical protein CNMCM8812_006214 [Aspergillus fumigatus]|nr:hypothetical protein CNMCM8812_006214 [Aspergillus fumigatus]
MHKMLYPRNLALFSLLSLSSAAPSQVERSPDAVLKPRAVCTPTAGGSPSIDDVPAIRKAIASCGNGGTIVFPAGSTYYLNSVLDLAGCSNCDIQVEGVLKFSGSTEYWGGKTAMLNIDMINGLRLRSLTGSGVIDGNGQNAYDRFASDKNYKRPTLLYITGGSNIEVSGLRQKNPPNVFNSVKGDTQHVTFKNLRMDATSNSQNPPKNTDGFDIGASTHVTISSVSVTNDDDCVAFKPGSNYVTVEDVTCTGSHGISVGSLGKSGPDVVQNILAHRITMIESTKAAGIKTYPSGNGHGLSTVKNVTFSDFNVRGCDYAFQIESCYGESESYCESNPGNAILQGIVVKGFSGTTSGKYDPVVANLNCGARGTCDLLKQSTPPHTPTIDKTDNSHPGQASHAESAHSHSQTQQRQCGRVAGGKYLQGLYDDHTFTPSDGPIQKVDVDMPLTLTETIYHNGNQYLAPFCEGELTGRCVVYVGAYLLFAIMFSGLALGQNIVTIIVCRALLGLFGCVGTILVGGTFDDMYTPNQRAVPMATFSYIAILGTVGAPIYAGFIDETLGWRWISRKCSTIPPSKAIHILATKPALLGFGLWFSLAWFLTSSSSPSSPSPSRKKTPGARALPISKYRFIVTDSAREPTPEARLYGALLGSIWQPIGLFYLQLHVVQGATLDFAGDCLGPQYRGHFLYLESCYSFTSDCYRENSSSAIAGQGFMRNTLGALSPLFASQFFSIIWALAAAAGMTAPEA